MHLPRLARPRADVGQAALEHGDPAARRARHLERGLEGGAEGRVRRVSLPGNRKQSIMNREQRCKGKVLVVEKRAWTPRYCYVTMFSEQILA